VLLEDIYAGRYRLTVVSEEPTNAAGAHTVSYTLLGAGVDGRHLCAADMSDGARAFQANFRLEAPFTFNGDEYEVFFGSDDNGVSLKIEVEGDIQNNPGGTSTARRGG
jgi:hypothetical protein